MCNEPVMAKTGEPALYNCPSSYKYKGAEEMSEQIVIVQCSSSKQATLS